jgi:hypothetical protein
VKLNQPFFNRVYVKGVRNAGIGASRWLATRAKYEQSVNKGADKKTEGFTLCFLLVVFGAKITHRYLGNKYSFYDENEILQFQNL